MIPPRTRSKPASGLSLIELLVVLAIVSLLATTLAAGTRSARARTRAVSCLSHLRQWGLATQIHASDNQDQLPPDGAPNGISVRDAWYIDLPKAIGIRPYTEEGSWRTNAATILPSSPWLCPGNPRRSNGRILFHYTLNRRVNGSGDEPRSRTLSAIPNPSSLVWLFDNGRIAAVAAEGNAHTNLHAGGAQFLFVDGHVERVPHARYWDLRRNRPRTDPEGMRWHP